MRLENKVAIITGGGQGIGKATALRFAEEGADIAIVDMNDETGQAVVEEVKDLGRKAHFFKTNVASHEEAQKMAQDVKTHFGKIDILLNNAGILRDGQLLKMSEEQFDSVIDVNLKGAFNCTQAVAPHMIEQGSGRIMNASSVVGLYGNFGQTNYVASKAGIIGMTKVWARELGRKGICVNAVAPGFIGTEMVKAMPEKIVNAMIDKVPLARMGDPREVANVYLFLASDDAAYVNGTVISVDGGVVV